MQKLSCIHCGGALAPAPGQKIIRCSYCRGKNLLLHDSDLARYCVSNRLTAEDVLDRVRTTIARTREQPAGPAGKIRLMQPHLFWVPFYEISGTRLSRFLTDKLKQDEIPFSNLRMRPPTRDWAPGRTIQPTFREQLSRASPHKTIRDTRVILGDFALDDPAVNLPEWNLNQIKLSRTLRENRDCPLQPFSFRRLQRAGTVLQPDQSPQKFAQAHTYVMTARTLQDSRILEQEISLVYYPVWRVLYSFRNAALPVMVDGFTGSILHARLPMSETFRILAFLGATGSLGFGLGVFLALAASLWKPSEIMINLFVLIGLSTMAFGFLIFGIMAFAWVHLRYSAEIIIRGDRRDIRFVGKTGSTLPERLFEKFARWTGERITRGLEKHG
ncbi:hypothetical protein JXA40_02405 [bacterium]|nr:hypothetical protein [candidate division CSSED10-310 bacterium]